MICAFTIHTETTRPERLQFLVYYEYIEFVSKNNQHHFKDINMESKKVHAYAIPGNECCIVKVLDTYLPLLPPNALHFYMRALERFPCDPNKFCVTNQRVGINMLKNILSELSEKAGLMCITQIII